MRSAQPKLACLLMAVLIFVGTSSQALASLVCQDRTCPKKAAQAKRTCCPKTEAPSKKENRGCCCDIKSAPDLSDATPKITIAAVEFALLEKPATPLKTCAFSYYREIPPDSDRSPPNAPVAPDRGRAPPVA
jgi:hypothetical protein